MTIPKSGDDLWALAESIRAFAVRNAGQITHTPVLAHLLLLAVRDSVHAGGNKDCITAIDAYRDRMAREGLLATGPFRGHKLTASGHRLSGSPKGGERYCWWHCGQRYSWPWHCALLC